jgi:hypothetical protein
MGSVGADVKMEYDNCDMTQPVPADSELPVSGTESPGGCRAVAPGKKSAPALPGPQPLSSPRPPSPASRLGLESPRPSTSQVSGPPLFLHCV